MTLEDYIFAAIFAYPSLYYKETFEDSKTRVLDHIFLVLGNGIDYVNPNNVEKAGHFNNQGFKSISNRRKKRISAGEQLAIVFSEVEKQFLKTGIIFSSSNSKEKTMFYKDFLKTGAKYLLWGYRIEGDVNPETLNDTKVVSLYPEDKNREFSRNNDYKFHPYPFVFKYLPFYDEEKKCLIPKKMIMDDWREGILYIFKKTKNWLESDEWVKDTYYNWAETVGKSGCYFTQNWNKKKSLEQFCKDYEMPFKEYQTPIEMAREIVIKKRKKYIKECTQIIEFYS